MTMLKFFLLLFVTIGAILATVHAFKSGVDASAFIFAFLSLFLVFCIFIWLCSIPISRSRYRPRE